MSVNVNSFKGFVEFVSNKVQSGNAVSPSQFNEVADRSQMQLFEKDYETFIQTKNVSDFLKTFLKNKTTTVPLTGELSNPSDLQHIASIRSYYVKETGGVEVPVEEVRNESWGAISTSELLPATKRFPKYSKFGAVIRFAPKNVGIIMLDYFKKPTAPVWGYTTANSRPVYDPNTSTNFEWDEFAINNVAAIYLSLIGVNLKDNELAVFAQQYKQETNSVL